MSYSITNEIYEVLVGTYTPHTSGNDISCRILTVNRRFSGIRLGYGVPTTQYSTF